jgi:hypothetical protein
MNDFDRIFLFLSHETAAVEQEVPTYHLGAWAPSFADKTLASQTVFSGASSWVLKQFRKPCTCKRPNTLSDYNAWCTAWRNACKTVTEHAP